MQGIQLPDQHMYNLSKHTTGTSMLDDNSIQHALQLLSPLAPIFVTQEACKGIQGPLHIHAHLRRTATTHQVIYLIILQHYCCRSSAGMHAAGWTPHRPGRC
jgi:hypothetical protein